MQYGRLFRFAARLAPEDARYGRGERADEMPGSTLDGAQPAAAEILPRKQQLGGTVRRRLAIAAVLGVTLVATVALAAEWVWHCPLCSGEENLGTAYYACPSEDTVFSDSIADYTDDYVGPPDRLCPFCSPGVLCDADSAVCNGNPTHRWYAPFWEGYK